MLRYEIIIEAHDPYLEALSGQDTDLANEGGPQGTRLAGYSCICLGSCSLTFVC